MQPVACSKPVRQSAGRGERRGRWGEYSRRELPDTDRYRLSPHLSNTTLEMSRNSSLETVPSQWEGRTCPCRGVLRGRVVHRVLSNTIPLLASQPLRSSAQTFLRLITTNYLSLLTSNLKIYAVFLSDYLALPLVALLLVFYIYVSLSSQERRSNDGRQ